MLRPSLEEARKYTDDYRAIPLSCEIYSDIKTPIEVLKVLKGISRHCFMLESLENPEQWGRYTFLGFDPRLEVTCTDGMMKINTGTEFHFETDDPGQLFRQILEENRSPGFDYLPPFTGGLVGYFSYDYIKYGEPSLRLDAEDREGFKDVDLMLFEKVIAFDNLKQKIILIVNIRTQDLESSYRKGILELEQMEKLIRDGAGPESFPAAVKSEFRPLFSKEEYCSMVNRAKDHIREGDIFQVVLSNRPGS